MGQQKAAEKRLCVGLSRTPRDGRLHLADRRGECDEYNQENGQEMAGLVSSDGTSARAPFSSPRRRGPGAGRRSLRGQVP